MELNPQLDPHQPNLLSMYIKVTTAMSLHHKKMQWDTHQFLHLIICS
jgi:hypothetical protein